MTVTPFWQADASASGVSYEAILDFDNTGHTLGLTATGGGHAILTLVDNRVPATPVPIAAVNLDQFGGAGVRQILAGPGATGVDTLGRALPTNNITAAMVAKVVPTVKTDVTSMLVDFTWGTAPQ